MNDFEKAKAYICDRNHSLVETSRQLDIPVRTLKSYRYDPEKMQTAYWKYVHAIAQLYK